MDFARWRKFIGQVLANDHHLVGCALFKIYLNEAERINSATLDAINGLSISTPDPDPDPESR